MAIKEINLAEAIELHNKGIEVDLYVSEHVKPEVFAVPTSGI